MPNWTIEKTAEDAFKIQWGNVGSGMEMYMLLTSDHHFDNAHCDLALLKNHLDMAKELNAPILFAGDTFCAMQGKWDKRADTSELRPEFHGGNYLDRLVDEAAKFYLPYKNQIAIVANGNHEDSILARHQTDLTERLVTRLRDKGGITMRGGYLGFVSLSFAWPATATGGKNTARNFDLMWHHGYGGGGEVTRGMIDNNRTRSQFNADIFFTGHIHRQNFDNNKIVSLDRSGKLSPKQQFFLRGSSYKDDFKGQWQRSRGQAARPSGGYWLRFRVWKRGDARGVDVVPIITCWGRP